MKYSLCDAGKEQAEIKEPDMHSEDTQNNLAEGYTVVARRYRPRSFGELIGQDHVAQALSKAIDLARVGHAYLFTGARGVGKTSTARIFAKALNIPADLQGSEQGLEIERSIDAGDDIDVLEIDGASNRGIEEIRQLRANVNVRPSRSKYKIYIIDEVHMLTNQAFNALLKTLEEPPAHVKFIFCTTDPDKIPITVLSRCQRFDFSPVSIGDIQGRLREIADKEGYEADDQALALLARRANGSMRDSQSLLEQVMSFSAERITVEQVHALLGTANESQLEEVTRALVDSNALRAVELLDQAIRQGADAGQFAEQLLTYFRDVMTAGLGGDEGLLKMANPASLEKLKELAAAWGIQTVLSAVQLMDDCLVRMRSSVSASTLLEITVVQICSLEQLASIPALIEALGAETTVAAVPGHAASEKKNGSPPPADVDNSRPHATDVPPPPQAATLPPQHVAAPSTDQPLVRETPPNANAEPVIAPPEPSAEPTVARPASAELATSHSDQALASNTARSENQTHQPEVSQSDDAGASSDALAQWRSAMAELDGLLADYASVALAVVPVSGDCWRIEFSSGGAQPKEYCEQSEKKALLQQALAKRLGRQIQLQFELRKGQTVRPKATISQSALRARKLRELSNDPYVKRLCEVLGGEILRVDPAKTERKPNGQINVSADQTN